MGHTDIRTEIDVAVRSWNPKRANPRDQTLPFNPLVLHREVAKQLKVVVERAGWKLESPVYSTGGAFRLNAWFKRPNYLKEIRLPPGLV